MAEAGDVNVAKCGDKTIKYGSEKRERAAEQIQSERLFRRKQKVTPKKTRQCGRKITTASE